jgi:hypothetical protein
LHPQKKFFKGGQNLKIAHLKNLDFSYKTLLEIKRGFFRVKFLNLKNFVTVNTARSKLIRISKKNILPMSSQKLSIDPIY